MLEPGSGQACGREFGVQFPFWFKFPAIMQSGSGHSIFFLKNKLLTIMQSGIGRSEVATTAWFSVRLTSATIMLSGTWSPVSFQVTTSDHHAVRNWYVGFCNNHISLRFLGTRDICLPWVVGLQGDRHLYRLIQAASTGVNLLLWRHLGTKAKERPAAMFFPHQRSPYVRRSTTAICGEF